MSDPTRAVLMYKAPDLGRVKTRLAKEIGEAAALELYRWMGRRQLEVIPSDWVVETRFTPDAAIDQMRQWLGMRPELKEQGDGDLGERIRRAALSCFNEAKPRKLFFLGADCLDIDQGLLKEAAAALDHSDFVIGPATDGGYYLLGMKWLEPFIFENISWGSPSVFDETMDRIQTLGRTAKLLEQKVDIDDWGDLQDQREFVDSALWDRMSLPKI